MRIGANSETRLGSLGNNLGAGAGDSGEQPVQASFTRDELDLPDAVPPNQFIVPLSDAKDFVYRLDPFSGHALFSGDGRERLAKRHLEAPGL